MYQTLIWSAVASDDAGGLLFTSAEVEAFAAIANEAGIPFDPHSLGTTEAP